MIQNESKFVFQSYFNTTVITAYGNRTRVNRLLRARPDRFSTNVMNNYIAIVYIVVRTMR